MKPTKFSKLKEKIKYFGKNYFKKVGQIIKEELQSLIPNVTIDTHSSRVETLSMVIAVTIIFIVVLPLVLTSALLIFPISLFCAIPETLKDFERL